MREKVGLKNGAALSSSFGPGKRLLRLPGVGPGQTEKYINYPSELPGTPWGENLRAN